MISRLAHRFASRSAFAYNRGVGVPSSVCAFLFNDPRGAQDVPLIAIDRLAFQTTLTHTQGEI